MMKIKKEYIPKILCAVIISVLFTANIAWSSFCSRETLRLPLGQEDDTLLRIKAVYIKKALEPYPTEQEYLLDPQHTTLLLAAMEAKPVYWSWRPLKDGELKIIEKISDILQLRFILYKPLSDNDNLKLCFVYNPMMLADVFISNKEKLLNPKFYLGRITNPEDCIEDFRRIDLEKIANSRNFSDITGQLILLDKYLINISSAVSGKPAGLSENFENPEPFPLGLAMGYDSLDTEEYFRVRKEMLSPKAYLDVIVSKTHDFMVASTNSKKALSLVARWIEIRDKAQQIINPDSSLAEVNITFISKNRTKSSL